MLLLHLIKISTNFIEDFYSIKDVSADKKALACTFMSESRYVKVDGLELNDAEGTVSIHVAGNLKENNYLKPTTTMHLSIGCKEDFIKFLEEKESYNNLIEETKQIKKENEDFKDLLHELTNMELPIDYRNFIDGFTREKPCKGTDLSKYVKEKCGKLKAMFDCFEIGKAAFPNGSSGRKFIFIVYKVKGNDTVTTITEFKMGTHTASVFSTKDHTYTSRRLIIVGILGGLILFIALIIFFRFLFGDGKNITEAVI
ncbi:hypothetical protein ECANGB1_1232 [Enterospora canceri]|uniref:Uncharacterized protein n=1 Tax=Enterospora canceri TaxID=1081671 RepID=A0A1Y1S6L1_9MICR|nr:hypothetical protein ECANGB1_1232 [Enterospora canceri]